MNQDLSITAAATRAPGPADAGAGADRAAGHVPMDTDVPERPAASGRQDASGSADTSGHPESREKAATSGEPGGGTRAAAVYRTAGGWRVGGEELPDLVSAIVFADLLVSELPSSDRPIADGSKADTGGASDKEAARLKMTIAQLEHALANRVRVEQAIGVLTERHRLPPRQAFEMLRTAARSRGRRVQELADEVVTNVTNPLLPVAEELARPRTAPRGRGRSRSA